MGILYGEIEEASFSEDVAFIGLALESEPVRVVHELRLNAHLVHVLEHRNVLKDPEEIVHVLERGEEATHQHQRHNQDWHQR